VYKGVIREKPTTKEEAREFIKGFVQVNYVHVFYDTISHL